MARRINFTFGVLAAALAMLLGAMTGSLGMPNAGALPDNCTKVQGTVTCTTFEGPGNNQGGVGTTESADTQGNTSNKNPDPQELEDSCSKKPPTANGGPIGDCP